MLALVFGSANCGEERAAEQHSTAPLPQLVALQVAESEAQIASPELIYEATRVLTPDGEEVDVTESGEVTVAMLQRAARPWSYFHEQYIYHEEAWNNLREDGNAEHGYRLFRTINKSPVELTPIEGPPELDPEVETFFAEHPGETLTVIMNVKYLPAYDIPPMPGQLVSVEDMLALQKQRDSAVAAREALFAELAAPVIEAIEANGGAVLAVGNLAGWIEAEVDAETFGALAAREDLRNIARHDYPAQLLWNLGEGRANSRMGVDKFLTQLYDGEEPNGSRHSYGDITIAIADTRPEDEACFLYDSYTSACSGASRLQERFDCSDTDGDGDFCEPISNFADLDSDKSHGTKVASAAMGSYRHGEGNGFGLGDPAWTSGAHTSTWENIGTGMSPEARLIFFDIGQGTSTEPWVPTAGWANSLADAADRKVDIFSGSWAKGGVDCNPYSTGSVEQELEVAFDEGVFVIMAAGNNDANETCANPDWTSCSIMNPADTIKAFAVNAFNAETSACEGDYNQCYWDHCYYRLGGMSVLSGGYVRARAIAGIAAMGPNQINQLTNQLGSHGEATSGFTGTSAVAPQFAGLAANLKHQYLANGHTWVNNPGYMNVLMMGMTDRRYETSGGSPSRLSIGVDDVYGLGLVRMRMMHPNGGMNGYGTRIYGLSFTNTSYLWSSTPWSTALPAGTQTLKCVMYQPERYSPSYPSISNLDLRVRLREPGSGSSCSTVGSVLYSSTDNSYDTVSMVRLPPTELAGRCVEVSVIPISVTSYGTTAKVYCQYAGVLDYAAPN